MIPWLSDQVLVNHVSNKSNTQNISPFLNPDGIQPVDVTTQQKRTWTMQVKIGTTAFQKITMKTKVTEEVIKLSTIKPKAYEGVYMLNNNIYIFQYL